jgi:glucose/arabinose dehydrogenase
MIDQPTGGTFMASNRWKHIALMSGLLLIICSLAGAQDLKLVPRRISLKNGRTFELHLPQGFEIAVAAEGLRRVRFMAKSPDGRIFVTDMYNLADNRRGAVYVLEDFDAASGRFRRVSPYLTHLRNPNSIAFHTDARGRSWFYLALTDRLVRYRYTAGERAPSGEPEVLATFPDYGLSYKYGGWHLTRTVIIGGNGKLYVSAGSSCNACVEKEDVRATVLEMNPDGTNRRIYARGLRNAVGLKWLDGKLYATNMGADHLGDDRPEDTLYVVREGADYGWPYCYQYRARIYADPRFPRPGGCRDTPPAYATFGAHSSPLGLEYFAGTDNRDPALSNSFLVALHGSTKVRLNRGYRISRVRGWGASAPQDFITGFLRNGKINGRPCDIMRAGPDSFFFTDDRAGVVYYVYRKGAP